MRRYYPPIQIIKDKASKNNYIFGENSSKQKGIIHSSRWVKMIYFNNIYFSIETRVIIVNEELDGVMTFYLTYIS